MSLKCICKAHFNKTPGEEIRSSFSRSTEKHFSKGFSLKGRAVCLLLIPGHAAGIVFKPLLYTASTVTYLFITIFFADDKKRAFVTTSKLAATAVVSPFGQMVKTAQAAAGVIHPGAYFKSAEESGGKRKGYPPSLNWENPHRPIYSPYEYRPDFNPQNLVRKRSSCSITFSCKYSDIQEAPKDILHRLVQKINSSKAHHVHVSFSDQRGIDAGGLRKALFNKLPKELSKKYEMDKKIVPFEVMNTRPNGTQSVESSNAQLLEDIGSLLAFLLIDINMDLTENATTKERIPITIYPIGDVISPHYFHGMLEFDYQDLQQGFNNIPLESLFAVYMNMSSHTEAQQEFLRQISDLLFAFDDRHFANEAPRLLPIVDDLYVTDFSQRFIGENGLDINQKETILRELLLAIMQDSCQQLKGLYTIAKAMNCTENQWNLLRHYGFEHVHNHVAGHFSREDLKDAVTYSNLPENFQLEFDNWIDTAPLKDVKGFVVWATGNTAIPHNLNLSGRRVAQGVPVAHTCFDIVDIPMNYTAKMFIESMAAAGDDSGFDVS